MCADNTYIETHRQYWAYSQNIQNRQNRHTPYKQHIHYRHTDNADIETYINTYGQTIKTNRQSRHADNSDNLE